MCSVYVIISYNIVIFVTLDQPSNQRLYKREWFTTERDTCLMVEGLRLVINVCVRPHVRAPLICDRNPKFYNHSDFLDICSWSKYQS